MVHHECAHDRAPELRSLRLTVGLKGAGLVVQVIAGLLSASLALYSDSLHLGMDIASSLIGYWAVKEGLRHNNRWRQHKIEAFGALLVGILLVIAAAVILIHAYQRTMHPPDVLSIPMLAGGLCGLLINFLNIRLLHCHMGNLTIGRVLAHEVSDFGSSVAVIVAGLIIQATGYVMIDTYVSFVVGSVILVWAFYLCCQPGIALYRHWHPRRPRTWRDER